MSVGWPAQVRLFVFGRLLLDTFGEMPYLVGSAVNRKDWRDVDVVVMMGKEKFFHWMGSHGQRGVRYESICAAFSLLGKEITGLPIDFKIQPIVQANRHHNSQREAIGIRITPDWHDPECPEHLRDDRLGRAEDDLCAAPPVPVEETPF